ncbi:outer membrane protein assembly factor BamB family protein [Streptomyces sp. NPDC001595]|uniref:outer membrane protein assembly factor BamB family protein n=1 Tax=Streptomyces sp. NPDC001532 TaxID=3154520 RepID=UPI00331F1325
MSFGPPPSVYTQSTVAAGRRRGRRRAVLLGAVAAVLVAALSVTAWLWWPSAPDADPKPPAAQRQDRLDVRETTEKPPADTTGVMAVRFSESEMSPGERYEMPGLWATDKILAKGVNRTLVGVRIGTDAAPGEEAWKLPLAGPICGKTRHVSVENRTAVLFRASLDEDALCDHVAFVDLDDGKLVWQAKFPVSGNGFGAPRSPGTQDTPGVTLTHATVAVTWGGGTDAYDMVRGDLRWRVKADKDCNTLGAAGGRALLVRLSCWKDDAPAGSAEASTYKVRALAPGTGRTRWTHDLAPGVRDVRMLSADPAVLATSAGDVGITEIISLDEHGAYRTTVPLQNGAYVAECADEVTHLAADECPSVTVGAGQVFLTSKEQGDLIDNSNWIVGFDLTTGHSVKKFESGRNALLRPLRMSGDRLLALRESTDHISPTALLALDPKTGAQTPYLQFALPAEGWSLTSASLADTVVESGRVFFGAKVAEGPSDTDGKAWVWLALGIESAATKRP